MLESIGYTTATNPGIGGRGTQFYIRELTAVLEHARGVLDSQGGLQDLCQKGRLGSDSCDCDNYTYT